MPQQPNKGWTKVVDDKVRDRLLSTAQAAYENACSLVVDAKVLFDSQRFPRAGALAILAEEEFAKSFTLCICTNDGRWDSDIFRALANHGPKQAISQGMLEYWKWLQLNLKRVEEINRCSLVGVSPALFPSQQEWSELIEKTRTSNIKKRHRDKLKQRFFYVSIGRDGTAIHCPATLSSNSASKCIEETTTFKLLTEIALADQLPNFKPIIV